MGINRESKIKTARSNRIITWFTHQPLALSLMNHVKSVLKGNTAYSDKMITEFSQKTLALSLMKLVLEYAI